MLEHLSTKMLPNLEVDVNGDGMFFVNKEVVELFWGRFRNLFSKAASRKAGRLKVMFNDFPGGATAFELIVKFCYNRGRIGITPSNAMLLHFAAKFMEINEDQTMKYLENVQNWTWYELLDCLKQSQDLFSSLGSSYMLQKFLDSLVDKISMISISSPCSFSDNLSICFFSSTNSSRSSSFRTVNWLQDLEFLNIHLFEKVVRVMISNKLDHETICSFLLYYQRGKFVILSSREKRKVIGVVVSCLCSLDESFKFPFRGLCDMLIVNRNSKIEKSYMKKLERLIGSRLDQATLDDLLIPSPSKRSYAYDVDLILKFMKIFLSGNRNRFFWRRLKKVGFLIDSYLREVAPDPYIKPWMFLALASALPNVARNSHDMFYEAIDMYFEVHEHLVEEDKIEICSALNYDKLSSGSLLHLAKNAKFPVCVTSLVLVCLQPMVRDIVEFRCNSSVSGNEDEQLLIHMWEGKECRNVQKKYADIVPRTNVTCPILKGKSLPKLCS